MILNDRHFIIGKNFYNHAENDRRISIKIFTAQCRVKIKLALLVLPLIDIFSKDLSYKKESKKNKPVSTFSRH